jgi:TatD DNase family protein
VLVDTHCHLGDAAFDDDRADVVARARAAGVAHVVIVAESPEATRRARGLAAEYGWSATAGVHPHEARRWDAAAREAVDEALADPTVVAVGETGLDYHYEFSPREDQRRAFADHLELGRRAGRPVIVHAREADDDLAAMLRESPPGHPTLVLHSFSAGPAVFETGLAVGAYFSFSGMITFRSWTRGDVLTACPADRLLVETDAPYLAPVPYRGRRNEPAYLRQVVERLAAVRGVPAADIIRLSTANAARCFGPRVASPPPAHDERPD